MSERDAAHACITCGDVAIPMQVFERDHERSLALCVSADGRREDVEIALVVPVVPGEWLLVHAGTAIGRVEPADGPPAAIAADRLTASVEQRTTAEGRP